MMGGEIGDGLAPIEKIGSCRCRRWNGHAGKVWLIPIWRAASAYGSDVTVTCGHITISMLWGNTAYCVKYVEAVCAHRIWRRNARQRAALYAM